MEPKILHFYKFPSDVDDAGSGTHNLSSTDLEFLSFSNIESESHLQIMTTFFN